jgi:hypothetical protein
MKVALGTPAVVYDIASVASRSAFTLTTNYTASTGTVTGTLYKFVHLRIYVTSPFVPSGSSVVVQSGSPGSSAWYRRYAVSVINDGAQNVAHVPAVNDLPATTDSSVPTATYVAGLWTQGGGFMQSYPGCVDEFRLNHQTSPTSWAQICQFNSPPNPPPSQPLNFLTEAQIHARFPSCTAGQMIYYAATGNVQSCLQPSAEFSTAGGILSLAASGYNRIQEEGSNQPQRQILNFVGSSATATDEPGQVRTNITFDSDLNALASNSTNGFWARTGAGTGAARTVLGTANRIVVTNGDGSVGNLTIDIGSLVATSSNNLSFFSPTTSAQLAGLISDESGTGALLFGTSPSITTPTVSGGTFTNPRISGALLDANGAAMLTFTPAGSAVNGFSVFNSATGIEPAITVAGSDPNIHFKLEAKGTGNFLVNAGNTTVTTANTPHIRFSRTAATARQADWGIDNADNMILTLSTGAAFSTAFATQVTTFNQIPVLPASTPTTANQATRKQYVDDRQVSFSVSFTIVDPASADLNESDFGSLVIPAGGQYTITKCKVVYQNSSHTSGGSVTIRLFQLGVSDRCSISLDNTNNTVNTIYTDDVGDFTAAENAVFSPYIQARSGTITEKNVSFIVEGFRKVF